jgi:hypothetical protein
MTLWTRNIVAESMFLLNRFISAPSPNATYISMKKAGFFAGHGG